MRESRFANLEPVMKMKPAILGGKKIRDRPFAARVTVGKAEELAVLEVLRSGVLSQFIGGPGSLFLGGPKVREFELAWAQRDGFGYAISVNSWTSGLMAAIGAIGIEPGDEVICSPFTMSASATCALFYGGIPVFADIDPVTFCLCPKSIEERITPRTKAIVVVHLFGHPAEMNPIMNIARSRGLKVIEDAAQAPGVFYRGKPVGAIGDIGGFSLNYHKHIQTGEGGMIVTDDEDLARRCQLIRNHGENAVDGTAEELSNAMGANYRMTEIQAAIGVTQLERLEAILKKRSELAARLKHRLHGIRGLFMQPDVPGNTHAYYAFPIRYDTEEIGLTRNQFVRSVLAELPSSGSVECTALTEGYVRPLYLGRIYQEQRAMGSNGFPFSFNEGVKYDYSKGICPVSEKMYEKELMLSPIVRDPLEVEDMDDFADAIEKVVENATQIRDHFGSEVSEEILTPLEIVNRVKAN